MKELLRECINNLANNVDILDTYKRLSEVFKEAGLFYEQAGVLEKIYNLTEDPKCYAIMADLFAEKLDNPIIAKKLYEMYLYKTNPTFFKKYFYTLEHLGKDMADLSDLNIEKDEALFLSDRYVTCVYILILLLQRKEYSEIIDLSKEMNRLENKIDFFINSNNLNPVEKMTDIKNAQNHLVFELSKVEHHNDINRLAIRLNPDFEAPYINIIADLLTYENHDEALHFYNNEFAPRFNLEYKSSLADLYWYISDKFGEKDQLYNAVLFQQKAIDLELEAK